MTTQPNNHLLADESEIYDWLIRYDLPISQAKKVDALKKIRDNKVLSHCFSTCEENGRTMIRTQRNTKYFIFIDDESESEGTLFFIYCFENSFAFGSLNLCNFFEDEFGLPKDELGLGEMVDLLQVFEEACTEAGIVRLQEGIEPYVVFKNVKIRKENEVTGLQGLVLVLAKMLRGAYLWNKDYTIIISDKKADQVQFVDYCISFVRAHFCAIIMDYSDNDNFFKDYSEPQKQKYKEDVKKLRDKLSKASIKDYYIAGSGENTDDIKRRIKEIFRDKEINFIFMIAHNQGDKIALPQYTPDGQNCMTIEEITGAASERNDLSHIKKLDLFFCKSANVATRLFLKAGVEFCGFNVGEDYTNEAFEKLNWMLDELSECGVKSSASSTSYP